MKDLLSDHIWALVVCFVAAITAYTVLGIVAPEAGTLLRAVVLTLGSAVAGYAGGYQVGRSK